MVHVYIALTNMYVHQFFKFTRSYFPEESRPAKKVAKMTVTSIPTARPQIMTNRIRE